MYITDYYSPSKGLAVISPAGTQKYTEKLNSFTQIFTSVFNSLQNDKHSIDSCWESGNIYYANYDSGYVKKIKFDGTEIASLKLVRPVCVSVIQYGLVMSRAIPVIPQDDRGCWIADKGTAKVIRTDENLNILYTYNGVNSPKCIARDLDGGCLIADDSSKKVIKLSSKAQELASLNYSSFVPPITASSELVKEIKPFKYIDIVESSSSSNSEYSWSSSSSTDDASKFWLLANSKVYLVQYLNGSLTQLGVLDPLEDLPTPDFPYKPYNVGSIDVDLYEKYLYIGIGNDNDSWIRKYIETTEILTKRLDIKYPYILKVVQGYGSSCLYVLSDEYKVDDLVSSSSSNSSSSTEIRSSSSSSSSESSSSSSSESSSSSSSESSSSSSSESSSSSSSESSSSSSSNSSSSSSSESSSSESSDSSTWLKTSSSSSSTGCCKYMSCTNTGGTPCSHFTNWELTGGYSGNTDNCYLYIFFNQFSGPIQRINVWKTPFYTPGTEYGVISVTVAGTYTISYLYGPSTLKVTWDGVFVPNGNSCTLSCV